MAESTLSPPYYQRGSIQVWDFIRDQRLSFHLGNVIKYVCRAGHKQDKIEDLEKAIVYLQNELEHAKRQNSPGQSYDHIVISGSGVPGSLQDNEYELSSNTN
tara:strand:- start:332 stop:637 length:306 start_codon:yes stop_codon:yes gene_type:complete